MASSPLGAARLRRRLTIEEAAARAEMDVDSLRSLEENRVWRFGSNADAIAAALVYAAALGVSEREARELAGLPVRPRSHRGGGAGGWPSEVRPSPLVGLALLQPSSGRNEPPPRRHPARRASSPPAEAAERWEIQVDVYNGTRVGNAAASVANEVAGLAYRMGEVGNAKRRDYTKDARLLPAGRRGDRRGASRPSSVIGTAALPSGDDPPASSSSSA